VLKLRGIFLMLRLVNDENKLITTFIENEYEIWGMYLE
jgi:hypothetical protein